MLCSIHDFTFLMTEQKFKYKYLLSLQEKKKLLPA